MIERLAAGWLAGNAREQGSPDASLALGFGLPSVVMSPG
jgi:hypothetical protein